MLIAIILPVLALASRALAAHAPLQARNPIATLINDASSSGGDSPTPSTSAPLETASPYINPGLVPSGCTDACSAYIQAFDVVSCTNGCYCNDTVNTALQTCLGCILALEVPDDSGQSEAQSILSDYETTCNMAGFPVSSLTVGPQAPSSTPHSGTASGTASPSGTANGTAAPASQTTGGGGGSTANAALPVGTIPGIRVYLWVVASAIVGGLVLGA